MGREFFIGVYPGRYNQKGTVCLLEKMRVEGKDKSVYGISLTNQSNSYVNYGEIEFIFRRVNELIHMCGTDSTIRVIVDETHFGVSILNIFKDLKTEVKGIILSNEDLVNEEDGTYIVPIRDVLGNLYLLKDSLRIDFKSHMFAPVAIANDLFDGIDDFIIRNSDSPITHISEKSDANKNDNIFYASAIAAWYAEYLDR